VKRSGAPDHSHHPHIALTSLAQHLMPICMNPLLCQGMSEGLRKRMQGKSCFSFSTTPAPDLIVELSLVADRSLAEWAASGWI
jgi:hypothetical protein